MTSVVSDQDIQALVDDELKHEDAKRVMRSINENKSARQRYEQLIEQKRLLKMWWKSKVH